MGVIWEGQERALAPDIFSKLVTEYYKVSSINARDFWKKKYWENDKIPAFKWIFLKKTFSRVFKEVPGV